MTISDAAMAIGETVWCDEKDRPQLFGPIGVCLSMLTAWAPQRDVSLLNALARLSASTDVVRWSNIRPKITGLAKHPRCVQAVSQNEGSVRFRINSAEGAWIAGPSTHMLIQAALCSDDVDLQKQSSRDVAQILVPLYTLGNFARASEFESLIGRAESPDDDDDGKEPTAWTSVLRSRLEAACILGDRGLFYSNLKRWYAARETAGNHQPAPQLMLSAVSNRRKEFFDALVANGEPITTYSLFGLGRGQLDWVKHVLHLAARQQYGDSITPDDRPKLAIIDAFCGECDDVLLCCSIGNPAVVQLLLEYGADTEVAGYDDGTALLRAKRFLLECPDQNVEKAKLQDTCRILLAAGAKDYDVE